MGRNDVIVIGAGFGGLYALHKLRSEGFSVQGFETGDDVGGTWFWNRYPGARCDIESMDYSFSFDADLQQEWEWTERYAAQPEIQRYLAHVADRFDLRPLISFNTKVTRLDWNDDQCVWRVGTDQGGAFEAQYVVLATGSLSAAKVPDIDGIDAFDGDVFYTSSWPRQGVDFTGRRVGVIGTGSSAIQAIPLIAEQAERVTVFQRTPNFSMPARNRILTKDFLSRFKSDYSDYRLRARQTRAGWFPKTTGKPLHQAEAAEREMAFEAAWDNGGPSITSTFVDILKDPVANEVAAEFVRGKIRSIVKDPETAELLVPKGYPLGSKRVAVDTDYFETFNRPNVTLKDLRKARLEKVERRGVRTEDSLTEIDALVLATGFDAMTGSFLRIDVHGASGMRLIDKWSAGPRTYLGLMSAGFPNLFFVAGPGSPSVLSNMVLSIEQHVEWIATCVTAMRDKGAKRIEATNRAENDWVDHSNQVASETIFLAENSGSWYLGANIPGKPRVFMPYIGGVDNYRAICDRVSANGYSGFDRR